MSSVIINKFVSTLCAFCLFLTCCSASESIDSLESLRGTFTIENNTLTTFSGEKYLRYHFENDLHFDLTYHMKDLAASEIVYKAYKNNIYPVLMKLSENGASHAANDAFSKALIEICLLFGNEKHPPEDPFFYALLHQGNYGKKWCEEYALEIKQFIKEANVPLYTLKEKKSDVFTVAIITTTSSGGNNAVAESIAAYLAKNPRIKPILIDVEDIAKEFDPMMIATGTYTYDMIYSSIFQKTNDFNVISGRKKLNKEIHQYIPSKLLAKLKLRVADLNPDFIISTRSYTSDAIALASLGIPFRLFHPDFELCSSLHSYYRCVPSDSIRFWLPVCRPKMFKPLFEIYKRLDMYDESDDFDTLSKKISNCSGLLPAAFQSQFEVIGYPCSEFFKINDTTYLEELRRKWNVQEEEIPIFIVMGKHGSEPIKKIFDQLSYAKTSLPLKYIFICGKNDVLREEIKAKVFNLNLDKNNFVIHGLLNSKEMNEIMNISYMGISKAGGATVIESLLTNRHLLLMGSYPWEEVNAVYLMEMGLATKYDPTRSLVSQIENCIKNNRSNPPEAIPLEDWRNNIMHRLAPYMNAAFLHNPRNGSSR